MKDTSSGKDREDMVYIEKEPDMDKLQRQAMAVFTGCLLAMAAVIFYGMMQDKKEEEEDYEF